MQRRTCFVAKVCFRHLPLRTVRTRFRIHRSPVLAAITSRRQLPFGFGRYSPCSRILHLHDTRGLAGSTCRPFLHGFSPASSVLWRLRQHCSFWSTRSEAGPCGQGQRLPTFTVLPSASRRRRRLGQFVTATRPRTSPHVLLQRDRGHGARTRSPRRTVQRGDGCTSLRYQPLAGGLSYSSESVRVPRHIWTQPRSATPR